MTAVFEHTQAGLKIEMPAVAGSAPGVLNLHVPSVAEDANALNKWAAGMYTLSLRVQRPKLPAWTTNEVPVAMAPLIKVSPTSAAPGDIALTITCTPRLLPDQEPHTNLLFGAEPIQPDSIMTPADPLQPTTLAFTAPAVVKGDYVVRLRVEGVDSVPVTISGPPPKMTFDPLQKVKVA
jgi:hypothetical protein